MRRAAQPLLGTHDFRSLRQAARNATPAMRTVYDLSLCRGEGPASHVITFEIEANGFLYNMVRASSAPWSKSGRNARDEAWWLTCWLPLTAA